MKSFYLNGTVDFGFDLIDAETGREVGYACRHYYVRDDTGEIVESEPLPEGYYYLGIRDRTLLNIEKEHEPHYAPPKGEGVDR